MQFQLGNLKTEIAGGPYKLKPEGYFGIKMAAEVRAGCGIDIPIRDYCVPEEGTFKRGLVLGIMAVSLGQKLYVGCFGGIGRTGLYMAGLAKVMAEYRKKMHRPTFDPILYVRRQYLAKAVETPQQEAFINTLDVQPIVDWWHYTQRVMTFAKPLPGVDPVYDWNEEVPNEFLEIARAQAALPAPARPTLDEVLERSVPTGVITHQLPRLAPEEMEPCEECGLPALYDPEYSICDECLDKALIEAEAQLPEPVSLEERVTDLENALAALVSTDVRYVPWWKFWK
jgi:hypothetical protein